MSSHTSHNNEQNLLKIVHSNSIQWLERIKLMDIKNRKTPRKNSYKLILTLKMDETY